MRPDDTEVSPPDIEEAQTNTSVATDEPVVDEVPETPESIVEDPAPEPASEAPVEDSAPEAASEDADVDADADDEEEDEGPDLFLPGEWFVVHTYAGYENKVKANLASRIQSMNMEDKIYDVVVPTEEVMELKAGKRQLVQKKVFPGYILVRMELDDDSWYVVRNTPGVTGFVGTGAKPAPLEHAEVNRILAPKTEERLRPRLEFEQGEVVQVTATAFAGMSGPISEINMDQQTVVVLVDIFGRETPVTLPFDQVAKI
ncbi:MAG TPA: transcription termination/antitermination protein NusG [Actinomycetota bacterium]|nr:transcription termination/antitermination protein NusG [Actinomycetota bacterium]